MKDVREALLGLSGSGEDQASFTVIADWLGNLDSDDARDALLWLNGLSKVELKSFASLPLGQKTSFFVAHQPPKSGLTERFEKGRKLVDENNEVIRTVDTWFAAALARMREGNTWLSRLNPFRW